MATARTAARQPGVARFTEVGFGGILESAVYAAHTISSHLHAFKKTAQKTGKRDIDLTKDRLKSLNPQVQRAL
jgi:phage-related protein